MKLKVVLPPLPTTLHQHQDIKANDIMSRTVTLAGNENLFPLCIYFPEECKTPPNGPGEGERRRQRQRRERKK